MMKIEDVESAVVKEFAVSPQDLHSHGHRPGGRVKSVAVALCCQLMGKSQREIGRYFGYGSESSVGK